jgi:hypothetical protein
LLLVLNLLYINVGIHFKLEIIDDGDNIIFSNIG